MPCKFYQFQLSEIFQLLETKGNVQFSNIKMKNWGEAWSRICHDLLFVLFDSEIVNYLPLKLIIKKKKSFSSFSFSVLDNWKIMVHFQFLLQENEIFEINFSFSGGKQAETGCFPYEKATFLGNSMLLLGKIGKMSDFLN